MINLRTITIGIPLNFDEQQITMIKQIIENKLHPRTFRINLPTLHLTNKETTLGILDRVFILCKKIGIRWFNVPFNLMHSTDEVGNFILVLMKRQPNAFVNLIVTDNNMIDYSSILQASKIVKQISKIGDNGFHNFRVGVSCNPRINTPFFPFSYSSDEIGFSIALELPPLLFNIIEENKSMDITEIQEKIVSEVVPELKGLEKICYDIQDETGAKYHGIDVSIAPFPEEEGSIGEILELLGLDRFGSNGTLFFTSFLTDIIKKIIEESNIKSVGFNGVMYSLMEDAGLCRSNNKNSFTIDSLISYSSVCGCGLDMVPVPGNVFEEEIASTILDVAGLSTVLLKPLGVRLLPIPGKNDGEMTEFNMDFLCNTRIMSVKNIVAWSDLFKHKFFTYKSRLPKIDDKQVKKFWDSKAMQIKEQSEIADLKPIWYSFQEEDKTFLDLKFKFEEEKMLSYLELNTDMTILDLATGNGYWAFKLANKVNKVDAVDYCADLIQNCKKMAINSGIKNVSFLESSIQNFSSDIRYCLIFISGVLHYINDNDLERLIKNIKSYSKVGTIMIVRETTGLKGRYCINNKYSEALGTYYSAIYRTRDEFIRSFKEAGFELVRDENMFPESSKLNKYPETRLRIYKFIRNM